MIIALNVFDEAQEKGYVIDIDAIEEMLSVVAVPTVATKKIGVNDLLKSVIDAVDNVGLYCPKRLQYDEDIELAAEAVSSILKRIL
jgi:ferrous iron transport protein B